MKWFVVHEALSDGIGNIKRTGRKFYIPFKLAETLAWDNPDEREIDLKRGGCDMLPEYFAKLVKDTTGYEVMPLHA